MTVFVLLFCFCLPRVNALDNDESTMASCHDLYKLATAMEPATQNFRSPLFNEKTSALATAIGTVTNIGYYYFGFSLGREYFIDYRRHQSHQNLEAVRRQMAAQYCFIKS